MVIFHCFEDYVAMITLSNPTLAGEYRQIWTNVIMH